MVPPGLGSKLSLASNLMGTPTPMVVPGATGETVKAATGHWVPGVTGTQVTDGAPMGAKKLKWLTVPETMRLTVSTVEPGMSVHMDPSEVYSRSVDASMPAAETWASVYITWRAAVKPVAPVPQSVIWMKVPRNMSPLGTGPLVFIPRLETHTTIGVVALKLIVSGAAPVASTVTLVPAGTL